MGAQKKRNSRLRKKRKMNPAQSWHRQRPRSYADIRKKYAEQYEHHVPVQEPKDGGGMTIAEFVEATTDLAKNYKPSEYLRTAQIGKPYRGQ